MSDPFALYADDAMPAPLKRKAEKEDRAPTALDLIIVEKRRLAKAYRIWHRNENRAVLAREPRLRDFARYVRTIQVGDRTEMVADIACSWLVDAPQDVRIFALRLVSARCDRINRSHGFEPLDDPLPPESSTYFAARDLLHNGGRA